MATVADYLVIRDDSFTLGNNQERTLSFSLGSIVSDNDGARRPFLAFMLDSSSNASNLAVTIEVNDQPIRSFQISNDAALGVWEVFGSNILNINGNNTIQFRVESGVGTVTFSDVILWFQQNV